MSDLVKNMSAFDSFIRLKYKEGVWWNYGKPTHPLYADLWEAWQARVPEGYVVVPKEANSFMYRVFSDVMDDINIWTQTPQEAFEIAYKAMIEAAEK